MRKLDGQHAQRVERGGKQSPPSAPHTCSHQEDEQHGRCVEQPSQHPPCEQDALVIARRGNRGHRLAQVERQRAIWVDVTRCARVERAFRGVKESAERCACRPCHALKRRRRDADLVGVQLLALAPVEAEKAQGAGRHDYKQQQRNEKAPSPAGGGVGRDRLATLRHTFACTGRSLAARGARRWAAGSRGEARRQPSRNIVPDRVGRSGPRLSVNSSEMGKPCWARPPCDCQYARNLPPTQWLVSLNSWPLVWLGFWPGAPLGYFFLYWNVPNCDNSTLYGAAFSGWYSKTAPLEVLHSIGLAVQVGTSPITSGDRVTLLGQPAVLVPVVKEDARSRLTCFREGVGA